MTTRLRFAEVTDADANTTTVDLDGISVTVDTPNGYAPSSWSVATPQVLVDYGDPGWRYLVTGYSTGNVPYGTWATTDPTDRSAVAYDDSAWPTGTGPGIGFLDRSAWLRRTVTLPSGTTAATVKVKVDNYATVYWNGTQLARLVPYGADPASIEQRVTVPSPTAGAYVLAIRADDDGPQTADAAYIDAKVECATTTDYTSYYDIVWLLQSERRMHLIGTDAPAIVSNPRAYNAPLTFDGR